MIQDLPNFIGSLFPNPSESWKILFILPDQSRRLFHGLLNHSGSLPSFHLMLQPLLG